MGKKKKETAAWEKNILTRNQNLNSGGTPTSPSKKIIHWLEHTLPGATPTHNKAHT